jgi:hypothetical protein
MLQLLAGIIITIFGVIGIVSVIKSIVLKITAPSDNELRFYGVMLKGENADIELQMAMETLDWDSGLNSVRAYAVDCGIDENCYAICKKLCIGSRFRLITPEELCKILNVNNL